MELLENIVKTHDGSNTLYSNQYKQHYHNPKDGAINESLTKHIVPTLKYKQNQRTLNILDICFGLGYNTFSTIYYILKNSLNHKINIYSPELDGNLVRSLERFNFPKEFESIKHIIKQVSKTNRYEDENIKIEVYIGDAREYIKGFDKNFFDIVYQDAFSSEVNMELWTKEYFDDIYKISHKNSIISTYSVATPVRLSMNEAGYFIYEYTPINTKSSLCFKNYQNSIGKYIDMELKKQRNKEAKAIYDK
ncbi:MAG: tRNA (5-methylaminomethyl-2-thiouridine)(34)-methyltransferase MnmD [Campylobacterota bacterium]